MNRKSLSIGSSKHVKIMRITRLVGTIFCVSGIVFGAYYIIKWQVERDIAAEQVATVQETQTTEIADENAEIIETDEPEANPYWDFIKMSMMDVDFTKLKELNSDTIGWIKVDGTNINYPFVQASDNDFYLKHTFNRSYNSAGWVYLDYRNNKNLTINRNSIIYAHGRYDGSMFGTLKYALSQAWQSKTNNYVIKVSTPEENTLWQVFSVYRIPTTNDYIKTDFSGNNEFLAFTNILTKRSFYNFQTSITPNDKIITLSTCIGNNNSERMVVHAKLIKVSRKV